MLLAERPVVSEPAIDVNDSTATFDYNVGAAAEPCNDVTVADHPTNQSSAYERSFSDADVDSGEEQDDLVTPGEQQDGDISSEPEFLDETGRLTVYKLQLMWRSSLSTPSSSVYGHLGARI